VLPQAVKADDRIDLGALDRPAHQPLLVAALPRAAVGVWQQQRAAGTGGNQPPKESLALSSSSVPRASLRARSDSQARRSLGITSVIRERRGRPSLIS
jgi:hypothetical protein